MYLVQVAIVQLLDSESILNGVAIDRVIDDMAGMFPKVSRNDVREAIGILLDLNEVGFRTYDLYLYRDFGMRFTTKFPNNDYKF